MIDARDRDYSLNRLPGPVVVLPIDPLERGPEAHGNGTVGEAGVVLTAGF